MLKDEKMFTALLDAGDTLCASFVISAAQYLLFGYVSLPILIILTVLISLLYRLTDLNSPPLASRHYIRALLLVNALFFSSSALFAMTFSFVGGRRSFFVSLVAAVLLSVILYIKKKISERLLRFFQKRRGRGYNVLIVGDNAQSAKEFIARMGSAYSALSLAGAVGNGLSELGCRWYGGLEGLPEALRITDTDFAVFAVREYRESELAGLISLCEDSCVSVYFLPVIYGVFKSERQIEYIGDLPLINIHASPMSSPSGAFLKRLGDILCSLILIILCLPIMLLCAVGVRISSPGPILFKQRRVGRYGREFIMLKFRSMRCGDGESTTWTSGVDKRKTRFGNFLRKSSLDELPQLFNVLRGEMSLVGPRPEQPFFVEKFKREIPLYMLKHYAKPGITGLAQIRGLRGDTSIKKRIDADIEYIEGWSPLLDIKILLLTPWHAVNKSEKYIK